jgi:sugar/nucleoside kinase (ribokinase family)
MNATDREFDLVVVGELNLDLILRGDVAPAFGQTEKLVDEMSLTIGSSSAICACGAARLGLRTAFSGVVGNDDFGQLLQRELAHHGVNANGVVVVPTLKTGLSVILSRGTDRAILTYSGSIRSLRFDHLDLSLLRRARHLHLGSYFLLDGLRADIPRLFRLAHEAGLTTSLDTNFDPIENWNGGLKQVLACTDIFFPNETEGHAITGQREPEAIVAALAALGPTVALKLGAAGGLARRGGELVQAPALPVLVADTTGAGDSFDAGFLYGHLRGWPLEHCLQLACACGSLSVRALGGTAGQPTLTEALSQFSE